MNHNDYQIVNLTINQVFIKSVHVRLSFIELMMMLTGLISDDDSTKYVEEINKFATYYNANFLELNVKKTKEMIIDLENPRLYLILLLLMIILLNVLAPINIMCNVE